MKIKIVTGVKAGAGWKLEELELRLPLITIPVVSRVPLSPNEVRVPIGPRLLAARAIVFLADRTNFPYSNSFDFFFLPILFFSTVLISVLSSPR